MLYPCDCGPIRAKSERSLLRVLSLHPRCPQEWCQKCRRFVLLPAEPDDNAEFLGHENRVTVKHTTKEPKNRRVTSSRGRYACGPEEAKQAPVTHGEEKRSFPVESSCLLERPRVSTDCCRPVPRPPLLRDTAHAKPSNRRGKSDLAGRTRCFWTTG